MTKFKQAVDYIKEQTHIYAEKIRPGVVVKVEFSRRMKNKLGTCDPVRKIITYNLKWVDLNQDNEELLRNLAIHECCHLRFLYHNRDFTNLTRSFGMSDKWAHRSVKNNISIPSRLVAVCPKCDAEHYRHNQPKVDTCCGHCHTEYDSKTKLVFKKVEECI